MGGESRQLARQQKRQALKALMKMNRALENFEKSMAVAVAEVIKEVGRDLEECGVPMERRNAIGLKLAQTVGMSMELLANAVYNHALLIGHSADRMGMDIEDLKRPTVRP